MIWAFLGGLGLGGLGGFFVASLLFPKVLDTINNAVSQMGATVANPWFVRPEIAQATEPGTMAFADDEVDDNPVPAFMNATPAPWEGEGGDVA